MDLRRFITKLSGVVLSLGLFVGFPALSVANIPVSLVVPQVNPAQVARRLRESIPTEQPSEVATTVAVKKKVSELPITPKKFRLRSIIITGNTIFSNAELRSAYHSYLGKIVTQQQILAIVSKINTLYQRQGYALSRAIIPQQTVHNGVLRIRILEGYVQSIKIQGKVSKIWGLLYAYGKKIMRSRPLKKDVLQRYVILANQLPGVRVTTKLIASKTNPAAYDLTFIVYQWHAAPYISYDNRGSEFLGPQQLYIGGYLNSIFRGGDSTSAFVIFTPGNSELRYYQLAHSTLIGTEGTRLIFRGGYTRTKPGFLLAPLQVRGKNVTGSVTLLQPLILTTDHKFYLRARFKLINDRSDNINGPVFNDRSRYIMLGLIYNFDDRWLGNNSLYLDAYQGLNVLGATRTGTPLLSRPNGESDFTKFNFYYARLQQFKYHLSVLVAAQGQYSWVPLLTAEEFSFGGIPFGRAYDAAEIVGDDGIAARAELRYDTAPNIPLWRRAQYFIYYDIGDVWNIQPVFQFKEASAASAGFGIRITFSKYAKGEFELDRPLTRPVATEVLDGKRGKAFRFFFRVIITRL